MKRFTGLVTTPLTRSPNIHTLCYVVTVNGNGASIQSRGFAKKAHKGSDVFSKVDDTIQAPQQPKPAKRRVTDDDSKSKESRTSAMMEANEERLRKYFPFVQKNMERRTEEEILNDWVIERRLNQFRLEDHLERCKRVTGQFRRQWEAFNALPAFLQKRCSIPDRRMPPRFPMYYDPWGTPVMAPEPLLLGGKAFTPSMLKEEEIETAARNKHLLRNHQPPDDDRDNVPVLPKITKVKGPGAIVYLERHRFPHGFSKAEYFGNKLPKIRKTPTQKQI